LSRRIRKGRRGSCRRRRAGEEIIIGVRITKSWRRLRAGEKD